MPRSAGATHPVAAIPPAGAPHPRAAIPRPAGPPTSGPDPNPDGELYGATCTSVTDCWAVGYYANTDSAKLGQVARFNGTRWSQASIPEPGGNVAHDYNYLDAIACTSGSDCWAVGYYGNRAKAAVNETLHWSGHGWKQVQAPQPAGTARPADQNQLYGVACTNASNCWAVGSHTNRTSAHLNEMLHWNGKRWSLVKAPDPRGTKKKEANVAYSVACTSKSACLSVGYGRDRAGAYLNQALRWNGTKWASISTPQPGGERARDYAYLESLDCSAPADCWAVGGFRTHAGAYLNQALHWNGHRWLRTNPPNPSGDRGGADNELTGVTCTTSTDCWSVGYYYNARGAALNEALRWDGTDWTAYATPQPGGIGNNRETSALYGVACAARSACWAVGYYTSGGRTLKEALKWDGSAWSDPHSQFSLQLNGQLAAAGESVCDALPASVSGITKLSCDALQQTVQAGSYPGLWQMTQVISATLHAAAKAPAAIRARYGAVAYAALSQYADALPFFAGLTPSAGNALGVRYYDDNAWVGMDLNESYRQSSQRRLLGAVQQVLGFERTGQWRPSDPPNQQRYPGGVYWNTDRRTRPIVANGGAAQVALELYQLRHETGALKWGELEYRWSRQTLGTPWATYRARVEPGGTVTGTSNDYGYGLMIGDGLLLYRITGNKQYLDQAAAAGRASLKVFQPSVLEANCPAFNAVYFYNLMALNSVAPERGYRRLLDTYARWAGQHSNPQTGSFTRTYGKGCSGQLPQAGVTGLLILKAVG